MEFKAKFGLVFYGAFGISCAIILLSIILTFVIGYIWLFVAAIFVMVIVLYFLPNYQNTLYELREDNLFLRINKMERKILYNNINEVERGVKSLTHEPNLTYTRLIVKYTDQFGIVNNVHMAPDREDEFVTALEERIAARKAANTK